MVGSTIELCSTCLLPYLSACIWATRRYPQAVILRSSQFLDAFRFLSSRFRPDCFSAGLVLLARSCMLSLVPILVQDGLVLQIIFTSSLIMCFLSMLCIWWYWHGNVVNCLDALVFVNLANMMLCGALVSDAQADLGQIKMVGFIVIGSTIVILSVFLVNSVRLRYLPTPWFAHFVCHHKVGAAGQSRAMQLLLQEFTRQSCPSTLTILSTWTIWTSSLV